MSVVAAQRGAGSGPDPVLSLTAGALLLIGLVMVASASISVADRDLGSPLYYLTRQSVYGLAGLLAAALTFCLPTTLWQKSGFVLLLLAYALLAVVLLPGVGHEVNGSVRWLPLGPVRLQVSEPARLFVLMYLAGYLVRQREIVRTSFSGFLRPMLCVLLAAVLLLAEPDFGAATVLVATSLGLMFLGGVRLRDFALLACIAAGALVLLALASPYRVERLTGFVDPWADPFDTGFQLTQSLIAIGRGEFFGVGLGGSVQKLFYLPEAHTDFLFAVLAEEFGLAGAVLTIGLFTALVWRAFDTGVRASAAGLSYQAFLAWGIAMWLGLQTSINIGVNMGVLPTKGLALPLVSYGGSSLVVTLAALGVLARVHHETEAAHGRRRRRRSR